LIQKQRGRFKAHVSIRRWFGTGGRRATRFRDYWKSETKRSAGAGASDSAPIHLHFDFAEGQEKIVDAPCGWPASGSSSI